MLLASVRPLAGWFTNQCSVGLSWKKDSCTCRHIHVRCRMRIGFSAENGRGRLSDHRSVVLRFDLGFAQATAVYLASFQPGMGQTPWTINSEIYPMRARSTGVAIATAVCWTGNLIISLTFLDLCQVESFHAAAQSVAGSTSSRSDRRVKSRAPSPGACGCSLSHFASSVCGANGSLPPPPCRLLRRPRSTVRSGSTAASRWWVRCGLRANSRRPRAKASRKSRSCFHEVSLSADHHPREEQEARYVLHNHDGRTLPTQ